MTAEVIYRCCASEGLPGWRTHRLGEHPAPSALHAGGASVGPWWLDQNHAPPGSGYLHLLGFAYNARHAASLAHQAVLPDVDMVGTSVVFRVSAQDLTIPRHALIGLWVQGWDPEADNGQGAYINIFNTRRVICEDLGLGRPAVRGSADMASITRTSPVDVVIPITDEPRDWLSLGSSAARETTYGHLDPRDQRASLRHVLKNHIDWGVILLQGATATSVATGTLFIEEVRQERPAPSAPVA